MAIDTTKFNDGASKVLFKQADYLSIARGQIAGHSLVVGAGYTTVLGTVDVTTVWTGNTKYAYPTVAAQMFVSSTSALDTAAGTGANSVVVKGLNASYAAISEVVALNGQTGVGTVNSFLRVFGVTVISAGSTTANQGTVYVGNGTITAGVPANKYAIALPSDNNSFLASYTVPAGYTAFVAQAVVSIGKNKDVEWSTWVAPFGMPMRKARNGYLYQSSTVQVNNVPLVAPEKTDIEVRGKSANASTDMSINFDILLIDNNYL